MLQPEAWGFMSIRHGLRRRRPGFNASVSETGTVKVQRFVLLRPQSVGSDQGRTENKLTFGGAVKSSSSNSKASSSTAEAPSSDNPRRSRTSFTNAKATMTGQSEERSLQPGDCRAPTDVPLPQISAVQA